MQNDWLLIQPYVNGRDIMKHNAGELAACVKEHDYVLCNFFDTIPRNGDFRQLDIYDMEIDWVVDDMFTFAGSGKGKLLAVRGAKNGSK